MSRDDLLIITGAGGFLGGPLALYFQHKGFTRMRAVDKKLLYPGHVRVPGVENLCLDVSEEAICRRVQPPGLRPFVFVEFG